DRHRRTDEDRRLPLRVRGRLGVSEIRDERDEATHVRDLEGDHKLLVVDAEAVTGMDTDIGIAVAGREVGSHDPGPLLTRERVPRAFLRYRIDDEVRKIGDRSRGTLGLAARVAVASEVRRGTPRSEVRIWTRALRPETRRGAARFPRPDRVELVRDDPQQQISIGARTHEGVRMHGDACALDRGGELSLVFFALPFVETAPLI